ncbi:MAG: zf-TFIIB domain-containing protein [Azovibrio sp.]
MGACCDCSSHSEFSSVILPSGLKGRQCPDCEALLVYLDEYHSWLEFQEWFTRQGDAPVAPARLDEVHGEAVMSEPYRARLCPDCHGVMVRYRVGGYTNFHLDRCGTCQLVWLDGGEWQALENMGLATALAQILSDSWQRRLQAEELYLLRQQNLRRRLGDEVFEELRRIQSWLRQQPNCPELLLLLQGDPL